MVTLGAGILSASLCVFPQASIGVGSCLLSGGHRVANTCSGPWIAFPAPEDDVIFRTFQKSGLNDCRAVIGWDLGLGQVTAGSPEGLYKGHPSLASCPFLSAVPSERQQPFCVLSL